jgi:hypothetical protein
VAFLDRAKAAGLRVLGRVCALPAGIVERGVADDEDRERQDERAGGEDQDAEFGGGLDLHDDDHVPRQGDRADPCGPRIKKIRVSSPGSIKRPSSTKAKKERGRRR